MGCRAGELAETFPELQDVAFRLVAVAYAVLPELPLVLGGVDLTAELGCRGAHAGDAVDGERELDRGIRSPGGRGSR
jgi:hypothetical protein